MKIMNLKMYILILDDVPDNFAPVVAAHASLIGHLNWYNVRESYDEWLATSFRKCVVKVNQKEFDKAKKFNDSFVSTEAGLDGGEVAIVLCPREDYPKPVKFYRLWKPNEN